MAIIPIARIFSAILAFLTAIVPTMVIVPTIAMIIHVAIIDGPVLGKNLMIKSVVTLSLALAILSSTPSEAARAYCERTVAERLDRLNVDRSDVRGIFYDAQRHRGRDNDRVVRILAWVSLKSCKGNLVIDMDRHCRVRQVYTRYECEVPGVPHC